MQVLVIGAGGMIAGRIARRIAREGRLGAREVTGLVLADLAAPAVPEGAVVPVETVGVDLAAPGVAARLMAGRPGVVFHLAAILSGDAEVNIDKGYAVNFDATRALLDAARALPDYCPRFVFASSLAVFGPPFPKVVPDDFAPVPRTSYGGQKVMAEMMVNDWSRRGLIDGLSLRLPTICVRPGRPNLAASSFFSNILREPLAGRRAMLPVPETVRHYFASPRAAEGMFLHAATMDTSGLDHRRGLNMPGLSATVGDQIDALRRVAGQGAVDLIDRGEDPLVAGIVAGWAEDFAAERARALGFTAEADFDEIIRVHLEENP